MLNACLNSNKLINVAHIKHCTKMKFSIKDFFSKCDLENYFFCAAKKFSQSINKQITINISIFDESKKTSVVR